MKGSIVKSVMLLLTVINIQGIVEYSENKEFIHFIEEVEEKEEIPMPQKKRLRRTVTDDDDDNDNDSDDIFVTDLIIL